MSLRESVGETGRRPAIADRRAPLDLDHLRSQTLGDPDLQRTVLRLFIRQVGECIAGIRAAETVTARSEAAHMLVGAARAVGAFPVARIAGEIEVAKGPVAGRLAALEHAADQVRAFIAGVLAE
jgi:HPt (histidine-containing phosphotransfer) domain-containing protein